MEDNSAVHVIERRERINNIVNIRRVVIHSTKKNAINKPSQQGGGDAALSILERPGWTVGRSGSTIDSKMGRKCGKKTTAHVNFNIISIN